MMKFFFAAMVVGAAWLPLACQNRYATAPLTHIASTPTYTVTPTGTWYTSTPTPAPYLIDNFEIGNTQILLNQGRNGYWFDGANGTTSINPTPFAETSPGFNSTFCGAVSGTTDSTNGDVAYLGANFTSPAGAYSIPASYTGMAFMIKGSVPGSSRVWFGVFDTTTYNSATHYDDDGAWVTISGAWTPVTIFFSQMDTQGYGIPKGTHPLNTSSAFQFQWYVNTPSVNYNFAVDSLQFTTAVAPTATFTPQPSTTPTPTQPPGATKTPTFTPTNAVTSLPTLGSTVTCLFPATTGMTSVGSYTFAQGAGNVMTSQLEVPSYVGIVTASIYLQNAQGLVSLALYADNGSGLSSPGNAPSTLIAQSLPQTAVNGWNQFPLPATFIAANYYWLVCQVQGTTNAVYTLSGYNQTIYAPYAWSGGSFPGSFPGGGIGVMDQLSMYLTYCNENTVTNTPTISNTPTITRSPTNTPPYTSTVTNTPSISNTPTITLSPTVTFTPTITGTPTTTNTPTGFWTTWADQGPRGLAVDGNGIVYVSDSVNNDIRTFTYNGTPLNSWPVNGGYYVGVNAAGTTVSSSGSNNNVQIFSGAGTLLDTWTFSGGQLGIDNAGNAYSPHIDNNLILDYIYEYTAAGNAVTYYYGLGLETGHVAVDTNETVYDAYSNGSGYYIGIFTSPTAYSSFLVNVYTGGGFVEFTLDGSQNIYVLNNFTTTETIREFNTGGFLENTYPVTQYGLGPGAGIGSFGVNSAGTTFYIGDYFNNRVVAFTP